jgi:hypothetical protein
MLVATPVNTLFRLYYFGLKGSILAEEDMMSPMFGLFNSE